MTGKSRVLILKSHNIRTLWGGAAPTDVINVLRFLVQLFVYKEEKGLLYMVFFHLFSKYNMQMCKYYKYALPHIKLSYY